MSQGLTVGYRSFLLSRIPIGVQVPVRLFLYFEKNQKLMLFRHAHFILTVEDVKLLKRKSLNEVYIHNDDWAVFLDFANASISISTSTSASTSATESVHVSESVLPEGAHALNVCHHSLLIAMALGNTDPEFLNNLINASLLHDIGITQLRIHAAESNHSINENSAFSPEFPLEPKEHLKGIETLVTRLLGNEKSKDILPMILTHHERYDGQGYPNKLSGAKIPIGGQIIALADHIDHLMSGRYDGVKRILPEVLDTLRFQYVDTSAISQFNPKIILDLIEAIDKNGDALQEQAKILQNEVLENTMNLNADQVGNRTKTT